MPLSLRIHTQTLTEGTRVANPWGYILPMDSITPRIEERIGGSPSQKGLLGQILRKLRTGVGRERERERERERVLCFSLALPHGTTQLSNLSLMQVLEDLHVSHYA